MNRQAFQWATERFAKRPQSKTGLIPIQTFETEKAYLHKLPEYVPEPYHPPQNRTVSTYGYVAFEANYYWVPEFFGESKERIKKVSLIRYANHIVLYYRNRELARYDLPADGVRNERFAPKGVSLKYQPKNRKKPSLEEEKQLRAMGTCIDSYVTYIRSKTCPIRQKHHFIRQLCALSEKITGSLFIKAVERAHQYGVHDIHTLSRIAAQLMQATNKQNNAINPTFNEDYKQRESYRQGRFNPEDGDRSIPGDEETGVDGNEGVDV